MKKYRLVSLFLLTIIVSSLNGMEIPPDSCLKMVCDNDIGEWGVPRNLDSVMIDSCKAEPSQFKDIYSKRFFQIYLKTDFYPFDKAIPPDGFKTADDLRDDLPNIKNQVKQIVDSLGTIYFIRSLPGRAYYPDSSLVLGRTYVAFYFERIQNTTQVCDMFSKVDSVINVFYNQRCEALLFYTSKEDSENNERNDIYPNPVTDYISLHIADTLKEEKVFIYNTLGIKVLEDFYSQKLDVRDLPSGSYFLKFMNKTYKFLKY